MSSPTTKTGRPRLGGKMDVLGTDDTWLPVEVCAVWDGHDSRGQGVIWVTLRYLDDEGGVSDRVRWDSIEWRPSS